MKTINVKKDDVVILNLPDGSNMQVEVKEDNIFELSFYTSTKEGYYREQPVLHMKSTNTFEVELRRTKGSDK